MNRLRRTTLAAVAVTSLGLLGACGSPSAKAVAKDVVQSLGLPADQQACMLEAIDEMSADELEALGKANEEEVIRAADDGNEALQAFIADLERCRDDNPG